MIESFNNLFFVITVLFGINTPILSNSTDVIIDTKNQTISINYIDLKTYGDYQEHTSYLINSMDSLIELTNKFSVFDLINNNSIQLDTTISYEVVLKYKSIEDVKKHFKIDLDSNLIFVHPNELIYVNTADTLNTYTEQGEKLFFQKSADNKYEIRYTWELDEIKLDLIPLIIEQ